MTGTLRVEKSPVLWEEERALKGEEEVSGARGGEVSMGVLRHTLRTSRLGQCGNERDRRKRLGRCVTGGDKLTACSFSFFKKSSKMTLKE